MKKGKNFTRRYYEDLYERLEAESKFLDKKKLEQKKSLVITSFNEALINNLFTLEETKHFINLILKLKSQEELSKPLNVSSVRTDFSMSENRRQLIVSDINSLNTLSLSELKMIVNEKKNSFKPSDANDDKKHFCLDHSQDEKLLVKSEMNMIGGT